MIKDKYPYGTSVTSAVSGDPSALGTLTFLEYFGCLLAKAHIPFDYGIVSNRANEPASQMLGSNYSTFLRLSDGSAVYFPYWGQQEEPLGKVPEKFKGRQAILTDLKTTFILE